MQSCVYRLCCSLFVYRMFRPTDRLCQLVLWYLLLPLFLSPLADLLMYLAMGTFFVHPPHNKYENLYNVISFYIETYQNTISEHIKSWYHYYLCCSFDQSHFSGNAGMASNYQKGFSNSSFAMLLRPPRAGMHTKMSASTS